MAAFATVSVQNSQQAMMLNTVLIHVAVGTSAGAPLSEIFNLGTILPGSTASASPAFGAGFLPPFSSGGSDYWTLLFSNTFGAGNPFQVVNAIPPTVSNITQNENGQAIIFNVQTDGECAINNPTNKDVTVSFAALGSSADYAFLSDGQVQPGTASTASKPAQLSARA